MRTAQALYELDKKKRAALRELFVMPEIDMSASREIFPIAKPIGDLVIFEDKANKSAAQPGVI